MKFICIKKERLYYKGFEKFGLSAGLEYKLEFLNISNPTNSIVLQVDQETAVKYKVDGEYEFNI